MEEADVRTEWEDCCQLYERKPKFWIASTPSLTAAVGRKKDGEKANPHERQRTFLLIRDGRLLPTIAKEVEVVRVEEDGDKQAKEKTLMLGFFLCHTGGGCRRLLLCGL